MNAVVSREMAVVPGVAAPARGTTKKEQIKSLLSSGCPVGAVANAVGCEASYVSQLMAEEDFAQEVVQARIGSLKEQSERDGKYDRIEDGLLEKLELQLPMMLNPDRILRALTVVNKATRRGPTNDISQQAPTNVINLILPQIALKQFRVDGSNQVIEVEGKSLVSMPARRLMEQLQVVNEEERILQEQEIINERKLLDGPHGEYQKQNGYNPKVAKRTGITIEDF